MSELPKNRPCFVYLIIADSPLSWPGSDLFKVGISEAPNSRLSCLRTASPFPLSMPFTWKLPSREAAFQIEKEFHSDHVRFRTSGEWFSAHVTASACDIDFSIIGYHRRDILSKSDDEIDEIDSADIEDLLRFLSFVGMDEKKARDASRAVYGEVEAI